MIGDARNPWKRELLVSVRPKHWIKNVLVFAAPAFAHELTHGFAMAKSLWAFAVFCALASGSYLYNDMADIHGDRAHPMKRTRPLADGRLDARTAALAAAGLTIAGLVGAWLLGREFLMVAGAFVLTHVVYTAILQHVVILDVFALAANHVLRVAAGAVAVGVPMSPWLMICTMLLALFLGLSARSLDFKLLKDDAVLHRKALAEYNPYLLDQMIAVITSAILVTYTLYTISPATAQKFGTASLPLTVPFVLYGIFRYLYLIHQQTEAPTSLERALISDRPLRINAAAYAIVVFAIIYL